MARFNQHRRLRGSDEAYTLIPQSPPTFNGTSGPTPRPPGIQTRPPNIGARPPAVQSHSPAIQPPPPYEATPTHVSDGNQAARAQRQPHSPPLRPVTRTSNRRLGCFVVILVLLSQTIAFLTLSSKIEEYNKATAWMREERSAMVDERERLEKARIPPGAFWEAISPAEDCRAYGTREYWGILRNIPENQADLDACMNMPVEIKGITFSRPHRCAYVDKSPHVHGFWMVDRDQADCKPWYKDVTDKVFEFRKVSHSAPLMNTKFQGCTNLGSGTRRIEAQVMGINDKPAQNWRLLCETTPLTWKHVTYEKPTRCESHVSIVLTCALSQSHMLTDD